MSISLLKIENLRNISEAEIHFSDQFNFITGANGSGKSSLLEAIYILARGRSYRSNRFGSVVQSDKQAITLYAQAHTTSHYRIGITKTSSKTDIRINGNTVYRVSDIARITPLQIITPSSHEILERGPEYRKRFIEWGVFHVEHHYFEIYKRFYKILKQRNSLLRSNQSSDAWDNSFCIESEKLNNIRRKYVEALNRHFEIECVALGLNCDLKLFWKSGWDTTKSLSDVLVENLNSDLKRGFTQAGPQRADLKINLKEKSAHLILSRGQQKMLLIALQFAQLSLYKETYGYSPIVLIDDLVSELDSKNKNKTLERLSTLAPQVFITSIDPIESPIECKRADLTITKGRVSLR